MAVSASVAGIGSTNAIINYTVSGVAIQDQPWDMTVSGGGTYTNVPSGQNNGGTSGQFNVDGLSPSTSYTLTIRVLSGADGHQLFSTTVSFTTSSGTSAPAWTDQTLAGFTSGVYYLDGVSASGSPTPTYSVSLGALPTGISLNTTNGQVSGTPTVANESYSFTLKATNSQGNVTKAFSGTVAAGTAGKVQVRSGGAWVYGTPKVWNGSAWVTGQVKVWSGSAWTVSK